MSILHVHINADGGSQGSYLIFTVSHNSYCSHLSWQSKHLKQISCRFLTVETIIMSYGKDAVLNITGLLQKMCEDRKIPIQVYWYIPMYLQTKIA